MVGALWVLGLAGAHAAVNHDDLVQRADSLAHSGRAVQALSLYQHLLLEPLGGCNLALAHAGVAGIHWQVGNLSEAKPHLVEAADRCSICPTNRRTPVVLDLVGWMVSCGMTFEALDLLDHELRLGPKVGLVDDVQLAKAELHFVEGQWREARDVACQLDGPRAGGLCLQASAMTGTPLDSLSWRAYLRDARPSTSAEVVSELTNLHTMLVAGGRAHEALTLAQGMVNLYDPVAHPEAWTLAQLRVAVSAERAGKPVDALLAFHDANRAASQLEDVSLRARIAREQARFERDRGATLSALHHLQLADSLTLVLLQGAHVGRETRSFAAHPMVAADPFELAAAEALQQPCSPGAWPFACAFILLGLIAAALRANELKKALRHERMRALRIQRITALEDDPFAVSEDGELVAEPGSVAEVLARPDRLDFDDIIASLEMDHGTAIEWHLEGKPEGQHAPEGLLSLLSVTVKRLLEGATSSQPYEGKIRNDWHGIVVEIEGPENAATQELEQMFAGGTHSPRWNPVLVQIEKLAGRFTVEKRGTGVLSLTFMLPHMKK